MSKKDIELFRVAKKLDGRFQIETFSGFNDLSISQIEFLFVHLFNVSSSSIVDGSSFELFKTNSDDFAQSSPEPVNEGEGILITNKVTDLIIK